MAANAWITGAEIRNLLPSVEPAITVEDAQDTVDGWIDRVQDAGGSEDDAGSRSVVRDGALSDALRLQLIKDGYVETTPADNLREQAERVLLNLSTRKQGEDWDTDEARASQVPSGYTGYLNL